MRILSSFIIIAFLPFFMSEEESPVTPIVADTEYCNARYNFCAIYPDTILSKQLVSDNGDGVVLKSEDEKVTVTISGSRNVRGRDTKDLYNDFVTEAMIKDSDARIVYEILFREYYEVSFVDGDQHFYQKLMHKGNKFVIYQIVAPANQSSRIDQVREHLALTDKI